MRCFYLISSILLKTVFSDGVKAWSRERIELNTGKKKEIQDETLKKSQERGMKVEKGKENAQGSSGKESMSPDQ